MGHIPSIKIDAAPGELIDKITILEIKAERIDDAMKRANVTYELATLTNALNLAVETSEQISDLSERLKSVNERLWGNRRCHTGMRIPAGFRPGIYRPGALGLPPERRAGRDQAIDQHAARCPDHRRKIIRELLTRYGAECRVQPSFGSSVSDAEFMQ